ncbi:MAG TPA: nitroreductase family protein, partial [Puia sp.]|nr:nitroreductase family protein [Puia sp.]
RPIPVIRKILEAGSWAPTAHNMQNFEIVVDDDAQLLEKIRAIPFPVSHTFVQENYLQLSFSEAELKAKRTGILATMFPKSWLQPGLIPEYTAPGEPEQPGLERHNQLLTCPALVVVLYDPSRRAPASHGDFLGGDQRLFRLQIGPDHSCADCRSDNSSSLNDAIQKQFGSS